MQGIDEGKEVDGSVQNDIGFGRKIDLCNNRVREERGGIRVLVVETRRIIYK